MKMPAFLKMADMVVASHTSSEYILLLQTVLHNVGLYLSSINSPELTLKLKIQCIDNGKTQFVPFSSVWTLDTALTGF